MKRQYAIALDRPETLPVSKIDLPVSREFLDENFKNAGYLYDSYHHNLSCDHQIT